MAINAYGIQDVEYAPVSADGLLPTTGWKKLGVIADDAVTLTIPAVATTDIRAQNVPGVYVQLPGDTDPVELGVTGAEIAGSVWAELSGGTWTEATKTFAAPVQDTLKNFAWRITTKPLDGKQMQFYIAKGVTIFNPTFTFVRNDIVKATFTARSLTPTNASGAAQSPWGFKVIDEVPAA